MIFQPINVSLDEECIDTFVRRYHFNTDEKNDVIRAYKQLKPRVHACFHYYIENDDEMGLPVCYVVMTLGKAFDELEESLLEKGDIQKAYMSDCLGLELMSLAYNEIDKRITEITGLFPGGYIFAGSDKMPLSEIPGAFDKLRQGLVTYNEAYVLMPKKSVLFKTFLYNEKQVKHSRCRSCNAKKCTLRLEEYEGESKMAEKSKDRGLAEKGLLHLYTGEGKGKTTAAIGLAVRAAGAGKKVVFSQFMKSGETSELNSLNKLDGVRIIRNTENLGWFKEGDRELADKFTRAHDKILDNLENLIMNGECDVLILDEATYPVNFGIIDKERLENLIVNRPFGMEIVITGRNADEFFIKNADYITNMEKVKHPFDTGVQARIGIEY